jgi:hypothetical protein
VRGLILKVGIAWLTIAVIIAALGAQFNALRIHRIISNEREIAGIVTRTDCANHASVYYSFRVDEKEYSGVEAKGEECAVAVVGQSIVVYYDTRQPESNITTPPEAALWNEIIAIILACLGIPPFMIWRFMRTFR